jgi:uncharacterized protein YxjI
LGNWSGVAASNRSTHRPFDQSTSLPIHQHQYTIGEGSSKVAEVSKRWFRLADTYGVLVEPSQNDIVILAVTVAIDMMALP